LKEFQDKTIKEIMSMSSIRAEDIHTVQMFVREIIIQELVMKYVSKVGLFSIKDKELAMQPVMKQYWVSVNSAARLSDRLGLNPQARKQIQSDTGGGLITELMRAKLAEKDNNGLY